ncbi:MAG: MFS transporter [Bacteroidales bacterium]|nr:MFS transporter [Bacteroidales bacterium]
MKGNGYVKNESELVRGFFSSGLKTIFRSLQYRNYRLFFGGQSISLIGTWMQRIALPWLVYDLTGSAFLLGLISFAGHIPTFLIAPFAGVITDRFSKYRVLVISQVVSLIQALILAVMTLAGVIEIWHVVLLSLLLGSINAFDVPARHSFVVEMVEKKEDLGNAIALNSLMFNGARLIGPSVAGLLLVAAGEGICFLINSISYIFVIVSLLMMKTKHEGEKRQTGSVIDDIRTGLDYAFRFAPIKHLLLLLALVSLLGSSYQVLMPVMASEILRGGPNTYGFLMGSTGLGALAGALFLASRKNAIMIGRIIPAATALFGVALVLLSFSRSVSISLLLMLLTGLGLMMHTASSNTILQTITDDDKRGRVMSLYTMAIMGTAPFGSLIAGSLAKLIGTPVTIMAGGLSCIAGAIFFYMKLPDLKKAARPVYLKMGLVPQVVSGIQTASEPSVAQVSIGGIKTVEK